MMINPINQEMVIYLYTRGDLWIYPSKKSGFRSKKWDCSYLHLAYCSHPLGPCSKTASSPAWSPGRSLRIIEEDILRNHISTGDMMT